ncbi:MAG: tetratricopeptide repeat protein [Parcubacteria group bacterium]|jgi:tetratricopeptide (TPR) repeat protein
MKIELRRDEAAIPKRPSMGIPPRRITDSRPENSGSQKLPDEGFRKPVIAPKIIDWIIVGAIYLLTFLVPLFFLPGVPSILELNKQLLLVIVGGIAFLAWIGKLAWEGRIRIAKNFLLVPVLLLLIITGLSTALSVYRDQSMWGNFGTEGLSLATFIALVATFLVIINNFKTREKISNLVLILTASSFLASLFAIFQMTGKFFFKNPALAQNSFNTVGSVYAFSAFIGAVLILTIALILDKKSPILRVALIIFCLVFLFVLVAINFITTLIVFLIGMAVLLGLAIITSGSQEKNRILVFPMVVLTLVLLTILIGKNGSIVKIQLPVEIGLSQSASFDVVKSNLKDHALLGSGLSNYDLSYLNGKPSEINLTNFWSVRFNEASSRFLTLVTSIGLLGAAAFLFLIGSMLIYIFSSMVKIFGKSEEGVYTLIGITSAWIYLTILLFFYPSNITSDFLWWLMTAGFVVLASVVFQKKQELISETSSPRVSLILSFVFVLIIVGFISIIFLDGQKYVAAKVYNNALASDSAGANLEDLVGKLGRVTDLDPSRDLYHRNLSVALFALLNQKVSEKGLANLNEEDRAAISNLYFAAEQQADAAISLNPKNPDNLVQLAQINQNVIGSKDGADESAIKAYKEALNYDSSNPSIYYQLGQIYVTMGDIETAKAASQQSQKNSQAQLPDKAKEDLTLAKQNFEKAAELKSNYLPAQFMIAVVLDRLGEIDQAIAKLEESKKINPTDAGLIFQLGVLYYKNGQYDNARIELESAVKLADNYSNARYFLGLIYDKQGDKQKALEQFKKVVELNPDNQDVKKIVANLEAGKKALDGLEEDQVNQQAAGNQQQDQNSIQREQAPLPPETPIQNDQNQPGPNPAP